MNNSREITATVVGAIVGGIAGYLFFTEGGRRLRRDFEPVLDNFSREATNFLNTVEAAAGESSRGGSYVR